MEMLLTTLDDLAPRPLQTQTSPLAAMTDWLAGGEAPAGFTLDSDLELRAASEAQAAIRYVHHDIGGPEVAAHIAAGKIATKLGMTWNDRVSFLLTDKLQLKRLAFLDVLKEAAEQAAGNADEQFDADFALMTGELVRLFEDLLVALACEHATNPVFPVGAGLPAKVGAGGTARLRATPRLQRPAPFNQQHGCIP